ncbi:ATP-dependent Clp protease ATP-binding subunit [Patescibacteria group bacterium]|jgi:ATP-dependent Clp protease ATP-binding subunit ClpC|nr:ATP-dependent Clp protease ATP-binding subunit [Patescibacteria group bacterium]
MILPDLLDRFTVHLKDALQQALAFAVGSGRDRVEPGDLVVGLVVGRGSIAAEVFAKANVREEDAKRRFRGFPTPHDPGAAIAPDLSPAVKRILEKAVLLAHVHEQKYVGTEHLLYAMLESEVQDVHDFLSESGLHLGFAKDQLLGVLRSTSRFPELGDQAGLPMDIEKEGPAPTTPLAQSPRQTREKKPRALEIFARELTAPALVATLDPVIGREHETDRLIEVLCRRTKNNPILLGEPGTGKTAIVEGLAQRLAAGDVPDILHGKRLFAVDLALMVAGTMYRGEFEARIKQLVEEAKEDTNVILFIDEIHNLVGAGSSSGSLDAANILKPALARGEIRCIGATTWNEFKKHIEPDAALERRYQPVEVLEPEPELVLKMLQGIKDKYEDHHLVNYDDEAVESAVRLAQRYLTDRFFPDKAIDVLDEAAASVSARRVSGEDMERIRALDIALNAIREEKDRAVQDHELERATKAQDDLDRLSKERATLESALKKKKEAKRMPVTLDDIARVISRLSRVPLSEILRSEREQLVALEERLTVSVLGQIEAVKAVAETVKRSRLGLSDPRRPRASFLFVGPSGTGKTELAKALAKELFGREEALVKLDMSEFAEGHSVSKLLGSPAGYVGYREGNRLADTIRKHPHAVLLFDEFEKAHSDVQHLLLQALEDGKITDSNGRTIPFRHAYVVLTSNVGAEYLNRSALGFSGDVTSGFETLVHGQLRERFRPELLNRIDRIVVFRPLENDSMREIVRRELDETLKRLIEAQEVAVSVGDEVLDYLVNRQRSAEEGARAARRVVEKEVVGILGSFLLEHPKKKKGTLTVSKDKLKVA